MNENPLVSPRHHTIRKVLRVVGPAMVLLGLLLLILGLASFFFEFLSPAFFLLAFLGIPLLGVGLMVCKLAFLGSLMRYMAGETAPVAKDTTNYMAEGIQPGVRAIARAVSEGIAEGVAQGQGRKRGEE